MIIRRAASLNSSTILMLLLIAEDYWKIPLLYARLWGDSVCLKNVTTYDEGAWWEFRSSDGVHKSPLDLVHRR